MLKNKDVLICEENCEIEPDERPPTELLMDKGSAKMYKKVMQREKYCEKTEAIKKQVMKLSTPLLYSEKKYDDGERYFGIYGKNMVSRNQVLKILAKYLGGKDD